MSRSSWSARGRAGARRLVAGRRAGGWRRLPRGSAAAQRRAHVELVVVEQAEMEAAVGGEPHAVAGAAVRLGHGADEADDAAAAGRRKFARLVRTGRAAEGLERAERRFDARARLGARHAGCDRDTSADSPAPSGISLDEAHVPGALERERGERHDVVVVEAADHHRVELDRARARRPRRPRCRPRSPRACPSA